ISHFHRKAPYDNAAMTSFITWRDVHGEERDAIDGILEGTHRAIELLIAAPGYCAHYLRRYSDSRLRFVDETLLQKTLHWLASDAQIYNRDAALRLTRDQVRNTLAMRESQ